MIELFGLQFFRHAFLMSLLLSLLFGLLSFFVVMRKMAFLGAGIAHTAFGGVALGIVLGIHPFASSLVFCLVSALLIGKLVRIGRITYDVSIGIFFSFAMALGACLISIRKAYTFDLAGYLFGNILGVSSQDLYLTLGAGMIFIPFFLLFFHKILFMTFEEKVARVSGIRTDILDSCLLCAMTVIIVVSIKIVGIILVSALVVLPASFGNILAHSYKKVIVWGIGYTLIIMLGGLMLSFYFDTPAGGTMVLLGTFIYAVTLTLKRREPA